MIKFNFYPLLCLLILLPLLSCNKDKRNSDSSELLPEKGFHISNAWARPGSEDSNSAVYFLITNGYTQPDTITSVQSETAQISEVHESYEREEGMMGMRYVEELELPPQSSISFQPGSYHIMLMQLNQTVNKGDTVKVWLNLKNHDPVMINAPVRTN